jgi:hypothetical protein
MAPWIRTSKFIPDRALYIFRPTNATLDKLSSYDNIEIEGQLVL